MVFIYSKAPGDSIVVELNLQLTDETLVNATIGEVAPSTVPPLVVSIESLDPLRLRLSAGLDNVSYGMKVVLETDSRVFEATVACIVASAPLIPYQTSNPDAFNDLVGTIHAGDSAIGTSVFQFPPDFDPKGYVLWELLSSTGEVYASGNAFELEVTKNGVSTVLIARSLITVPSSVPPTLENQRYQLRYQLVLPDESPQEVFYSYENVQVVGLVSVPLGTQPLVELQGSHATVSIVVDRLYDSVGVELYFQNTLLTPFTELSNPQRTADGWYYAGTLDTTKLEVSIQSYTLVWKYWLKSNPSQVFQEQSKMWIINPQIMTSIDDVKSKIAKARATLYGSPDLLYPEATILLWLRRAADRFNGAYGVFTSFTFTNALGPIREYWLMFTELAALESQYLAEGEKAFNFSGAAISLDVDRTSFIDSAMSRIQSALDNEFKTFKQNLVIKGATAGDGSVDPSRLQRGAIGTVGITITPATPWGRFMPAYPIGNITRPS